MITGELVALRALELADVEKLQAFINDTEVTRYLSGGRPFSLHEERRWLETERDRKHELLLGIQTLAEGLLIGTCSLRPLDNVERCAELGISIGDKAYWSRGYGTDAMLTLCGYGFTQVNLHRIDLHVYAENARAIRCYEKCGFVHEGCLRQSHFRHGRYHDLLVMGLLCDEYREKWPERWEALTT